MAIFIASGRGARGAGRMGRTSAMGLLYLVLGVSGLGCSDPGEVEGEGGASSAGESGTGGEQEPGSSAGSAGKSPGMGGKGGAGHGGSTGGKGGHAGNGGSTAGNGGQTGNGGSTAGNGGHTGNGGSTAGNGGHAGNGGSTAGNGGHCSNGGSTAGSGGSPNDGGQSGDGGQGGVGGEPGTAPPGHLVVSATSLYFEGDCTAEPQALTLTNDGEGPVTWSGTIDQPTYYAIAPTGSTLEPGASIDVVVSSTTVAQPAWAEPDGVLTISSTDVAQPPLEVALSEQIFGERVYHDDIDLGDVFVSTSVTTTVQAPGATIPGLYLGGPLGTDFRQSGYASNEGQWEITFEPTTAGSQSATYEFFSVFGLVCTPSSFVVTGNGVFYDCANNADDSQCGYASYCEAGSCVIRVLAEPDMYWIDGGAVVLETVIYFPGDTYLDPNGYAASIAWGDGTTSSGSITAEFPGRLVAIGQHTYATSGAVAGTVTLTDTLTGASNTWPFSGEVP